MKLTSPAYPRRAALTQHVLMTNLMPRGQLPLFRELLDRLTTYQSLTFLHTHGKGTSQLEARRPPLLMVPHFCT